MTIVDFQDPTAVLNALTSNVIDCTGQLTGTQVRVLRNAPGIKTVVSQTGAIQPFTMRVDKAPFNNVNVRQAFKYLINRPEFISTSLDGYGSLAADVTSPYDPDYDHSLHREQDLALARHLLKKAGYDNDLTVTLYTSLAVQLERAQHGDGLQAAGKRRRGDRQPGPGQRIRLLRTELLHEGALCPDLLRLLAVPLAGRADVPALPLRYRRPTSTIRRTPSSTTRRTRQRTRALRREIEYEMQKIDFNQGGYIVPCFVDSIDAYSTNLIGYT